MIATVKMMMPGVESEEGSNGGSNEQGMDNSTTVNAMHTKQIHLHMESGPF